MSPHIHRRDDQEESFEHLRSNDVPNWLKWSLVAIKEVGFPVVAFFCLLIYLGNSQKKLGDALDRQATSVEALIITVNSNHSEGKEWRNQMIAEMRDIRARLK